MLKKSSDKNNLTKLDKKITKLDKILLLMLGQVLRLIRFSDSTLEKELKKPKDPNT